jgi:branched-chain amino acid transport system ATP-binding protein
VLKLRDVDTSYGRIRVLRRVNLEVAEGEIVCLLGGNASGKSTTMKTILGVVRPTAGTVEFDGQVINDVRTAQRIERGLAIVPENRRVFPRMTVRENLEMGAFLRRDRLSVETDLERSSTSSRASASAWRSALAPCLAASSRCSRWPVHSWPGPGSS